MSKRIKFFHVYGQAVDSEGEKHYVTIVGKYVQTMKETEFTEEVDVERMKPNSFVKGKIVWSDKVLNRKLTLGMSICHPTDTFDEEVGVEIAKKRIENGDEIGSLETSYATMLTEDAIIAELIVKLNHVCDNIDRFLS